LAINLTLSACGGGGGAGAAAGATGSNATTSGSVTINGTTYSTNSSTVRVGGLVNQTSPYNTYASAATAASISMGDTQTGNSLILQVLGSASGWPGVYTAQNAGGSTTAYITDKSVVTGGNMQVVGAPGSGGTITIDSFGSVGQTIAGSFNLNLCDGIATCPASLKNYTGTFSATRSANVGSLAKPAKFNIPTATYTNYQLGIHPTTGKNYFAIPTNATGGILRIVLNPSVATDMAIFTDPGFTTPATCDVYSSMNLPDVAPEVCNITVAANQTIYVTVSQPATATAFETFILKLAEV
jgi:hypothetical protein